MALIRTYHFAATPGGRVDFRLAYDAFRGRDPAKINKEERIQLAELQAALESISDPIGDLPEDVDIDLRQRKLSARGGTVEISQRAHERMTTYLEDTPFMAGLSLQVESLRDRWSAADKVEPESRKIASVK